MSNLTFSNTKASNTSKTSRSTRAGGNGSDIITGGLGADKFVFTSVLDGVDIIKDLKVVKGDIIQISQAGFSATGISDFSYNSLNGSLFFQESRFAIIENKPVGFQPSLDIQLV